MEIAIIVYILTFLFPINGIIWLGMMNERKKMRRIALTIWKLKNSRRR